MDINERIKRARKLSVLSQSQLAKSMGLSLMTIRRWETGEVSPRINEIQKLAQILNTSVEYLIGISNNPYLSETERDLFAALELAKKIKNDDIDLKEPITAGISGDKIKILDRNTNIEYTLPNNKEVLKALEAFVNYSNDAKTPAISNAINGDNNNGNKLGIINN